VDSVAIRDFERHDYEDAVDIEAEDYSFEHTRIVFL